MGISFKSAIRVSVMMHAALLSMHPSNTVVANIAYRAHSPEVMSSFMLHDLMLLDTT